MSVTSARSEASASQPVVKIAQGALQGAKIGRLSVFRGVPYATAERFGPPRPVAPWQGVRSAIAAGAVCPQLPSRLEKVIGSPRERRAMSEHCQVLSVFSPDLTGKRPVMVWIHGGAYVTGGGEDSWYDAARLADEGDIVSVTVTYRLGVFGYLWTEEHGACNAGLQDQIAALRWVHDNIASFGGDPDNITMFGQSAGGHAIAAILATTERPLFRRAILQSAPLGISMSEEAAKAIGREFRAALGQSPLTASVEDMLAAQGKVLAASKSGMTFMPVGIDPQRLAVSKDHKLDILAGWTRDDGSPFVALRLAPDQLGGLLDNLATTAMTAGTFAGPTKAFSKILEQRGDRISLYEIAWRPRGSPYGACHCIELPLLLGQAEDWQHAAMLGATPGEEVQRFGREARAIWAAFAKSGKAPPKMEWLEQASSV
jgi:para-nitrobenzyl esterase